MADHESPNIEAAAYYAREPHPDNDPDYPTRAEADREAALDDELAHERRSKLIDGAWTPTDHGYDEEAGW